MGKSQVNVLMEVLREFLRRRGLRYRDIARELQVTERTVTRWFASESNDTKVLERLCALVGLTFFELCELASKRVETRITYLSLKQEQMLADDGLLSYLFSQVLKGWTTEEIQREAEIPDAVFVDALIRLEKSGLIDLLPGNEIRLRTIKDMRWRPGGPFSRFQNRWLAWVLDKIDITEPRSAWAIDAMKLSSSSLAQLQRKFEALQQEALELSDVDRRSHDPSRVWYALVLGARQIDLIPPLLEWPTTPFARRTRDYLGKVTRDGR